MHYTKEIGIIISYMWLLIAVYLYDWSAFSIFLAYFLELFAILVVYSVSRLLAERKHPNIYRKHPPILSILIGSIPILLFQYFIIGLVADFIQPELHFFKGNQLLMTKENLLTTMYIVIMYTIKAFQIKGHITRENTIKENILYQALSLTTTNITGALLVLGLGINALMPILVSMIVVRIALEIYFSRNSKLT